MRKRRMPEPLLIFRSARAERVLGLGSSAPGEDRGFGSREASQDTRARTLRVRELGLQEVKMEIPVGDYLPDGTFEGEEIKFEGREVEVRDGLNTETDDPGNVLGFVFRLYQCPEGYRVHELLWPVVPGQAAVASLYPEVGYRMYGTYTEEEARKQWGQHFPKHFGFQ
jgi:hypothetical protein